MRLSTIAEQKGSEWSRTGFLVDLDGDLISINTDDLSDELTSSYMALFGTEESENNDKAIASLEKTKC